METPQKTTRKPRVTDHGGAPSNAEVVTSQTGYLVTGCPRCKEEVRAAYWELRKRADDAADGVPCDQIQPRGAPLWQAWPATGLPSSPSKKPSLAFSIPVGQSTASPNLTNCLDFSSPAQFGGTSLCRTQPVFQRAASGRLVVALAAVAALLAASGCTRHVIDSTHQVNVAPVEIKPIHITIDINIKVDRELENFFNDIDQAAGAASPAGQDGGDK